MTIEVHKVEGAIYLAKCCSAEKADKWITKYTYGRTEEALKLSIELKFLKSQLSILQNYFYEEDEDGCVDLDAINNLSKCEINEVIGKIKTMCADCGC